MTRAVAGEKEWVQADSRMRFQAIRNRARMVAMHAPGFRRSLRPGSPAFTESGPHAKLRMNPNFDRSRAAKAR